MSFTSAQAARWRDVYLAGGARGISACGDFLAATALALTLQSRGAGGLAVAGLMLASTVPLMLFAPLAGRLADRVDSRLLLVATGLAQAAVCAVLAYTGHPVAIIALVAVLAAGFAVTSPTLAALIPEMVGRDDLPKASAISQTANSLGMIAGPAFAGILVGQFGVRVPLLVDAASYLAIAVGALLIRTRRGRRVPRPADDAERDPGPGWSMRSDSLLFVLVAAVAVIVGAVAMVNVADVFFVRETLGASATAYGLIGATWTVGILVGAWLIVKRLRAATDAAIAVAMLALLGGLAAVLLVSAAVPAAPWLIPIFLVGGVINGGVNVAGGVIVARRIPAAVRGRGQGTFASAVNTANVVAYLLGGALLVWILPRTLIAGSGIAGLVAVAACLGPIVRVIRSSTAPVDPAPVDPVRRGSAAA